MVLPPAPALGFARRQSYREISNYLRGRHISLSPRLQCQVRGKRQLHASRQWASESASRPNPNEFLEDYKKSICFPSAISNFQTLLDQREVGKQVTLYGYLSKTTKLGKRLFIRLSNPALCQTIQATCSTRCEASDQLLSIIRNSPVVVRGTLQFKVAGKGRENELPIDEDGNINSVELSLDHVQALNDFPKDIVMTPDTVFSPKSRHLQIRNSKGLRQALAFRAKAGQVIREALEQCDPPFMEVETPVLFKSTPEGAREFLVPTRTPGLAYALPQSPQQYKQILMSSGIPRYYQFAHCFRDEDLRADRQPEFTQLDLEMSFARGEDVKNVIEPLIRKLWSKLMPEKLDSSPFPRMTYEEVMSKYGSDKPDTRIGMEIHRIDYMIPVDFVREITDLTEPFVEAIKVHGNGNPAESKGFLDTFMNSPEGKEFMRNPEGSPQMFVFDSSKPLSGLQALGFEAVSALEKDLDLNDGDMVILQARRSVPFSGGSTPLGDLRRAIQEATVKSGFRPAATGFSFLWVTHFPLFSPSSDSEPGQGGAAGIASTHHPFTAPLTPEDISLLLTDPIKATADHYDLVVNGVELGGGSRRIHVAEVQEFILRDILKVPEARLADFSHLLEALRAGCPPHAGIALGFDRLIAVMMGKESVRDVIAFPKAGKGEDLMMKTPSQMTDEALKTYHLQLRQQN